jgi:hypothetical protein
MWHRPDETVLRWNELGVHVEISGCLGMCRQCRNEVASVINEEMADSLPMALVLRFYPVKHKSPIKHDRAFASIIFLTISVPGLFKDYSIQLDLGLYSPSLSI